MKGNKLALIVKRLSKIPNFDIAIWIMTICSIVDTVTSLLEKIH